MGTTVPAAIQPESGHQEESFKGKHGFTVTLPLRSHRAYAELYIRTYENMSISEPCQGLLERCGVGLAVVWLCESPEDELLGPAFGDCLDVNWQPGQGIGHGPVFQKPSSWADRE